MNCLKCGNPIAPNMKFCAKCGTPVALQQPTQQKVVIQKPAPSAKKPKKKNKNLPLIIVAIVLVIAVIASSIAFVPGIIRNKNEIDGATEYIEDFPTLKQQTEFLVFDSEKFPSEKYEIKVERMLMGGVFKGETVIEDVSTEHIYNVDFEKDGDYRITLTDITEERTQATSESSTEIIEIIIIIDVVVDDDDPEALDKVDINSQPGDVAEENNTVADSAYIEATQEDFVELEKLLNSTNFAYGYNYDSDTATTQSVIEEYLSEELGIPGFIYFLGDDTKEYSENAKMYEGTEPDPLGEYVYYDPYYGDTYLYYKIPVDDVKWICENIFNVKFDKNYAPGASYIYGDYCYRSFGWGGDAVGYYCELGEHNVNSNGKYEIVFNNYMEYFEDVDLESTKKLTAEIKVIDGERYWSIYKVEDYGQSAEPQEETTEPTTNIATSEVTTANKPVTGQQTENQESNNTEAKKNIRLVEMVIKNYGTVRIELYPDEAPITVENFVTLARSGFYDGVGFHRLDKDFVLQGGDPDGDGVGGSEKQIKGEFAANGVQNNISHKRGVISMGRTNDPNSASSQFFICLEDNIFLDGNYAAFGYVTEGMNIIDEIRDTTPESNSIPKDRQPIIETIRVIN